MAKPGKDAEIRVPKEYIMQQMLILKAQDPSLTVADLAKKVNRSKSYVDRLHASDEYKELEERFINRETRKRCSECILVAYDVIQRRLIEHDDYKLALELIKLVNEHPGATVSVNVDNSSHSIMIPVYGESDILYTKNDE